MPAYKSPTPVPLAVPSTPLSDGVIFLRPHTHDDIPRLCELFSDEAIQHRVFVPDSGPDDVREWMENVNARPINGAGATWAICEEATGRLVGGRGILITNHGDRRASCASWISPDARGRRLASKSLALAASWVFEHWPVERIDATCDIDNVASYRSLLAAGLRHEGIRREYMIAPNGERRDQHMFGLLPSYLRDR